MPDKLQRPICVAGPGAIGLTLAARLSIAGFPVRLVARGDSLSFIKANGIRLIDREGDHRVQVDVGTATDFGIQDVLFLCPKSHDLPEMAAALQPLIGEHTTIVPVVNGMPWWYFDGVGGQWDGPSIKSVDPNQVLKGLLPSRQVIGTTTIITAERLRVGTARTFNPLQMTIGELDDQQSERLSDLSDILTLAGIAVRIAPRIRDAVWTKVVRNLISNPVTAITGATLRENFGNQYLADISRQMLQEVLPVIAAYGANLEVDPQTILESGRSLGDVKTSMLQDFEQGNRLELASICDAVIELANRRGIEMPVIRAITGIAHFRSVADRAHAA
ncbi:2-dehydropantoate 2-reductase [Rhizobium cauense]|uniref:ketopantoate reductase family protein n=1 Tax=Rhizobium cauense TaxID=1166683 RepID=UPI001C6DE177|nr:2-dehydropantoate 2-reductase [Rhizobium cauense]MBW9116490.1 2-dehydropantoate 2-reductase [Rhizobium cauense]